MVSGIPPVGITQNQRFSSCDTILLGVRYVWLTYREREKLILCRKMMHGHEV
jgi:hypothetical protein